jgi:hypothetical protein
MVVADQEGVHAALLDVADVVEPARLLCGQVFVDDGRKRWSP